MSAVTATKDAMKDLRQSGEGLMEQFTEVGDRFNKHANDAIREAKRSIHRFQDSTEGVVRETRHTIHRNPIASVAAAAGFGIGLGILAGYLWGSQRD